MFCHGIVNIGQNCSVKREIYPMVTASKETILTQATTNRLSDSPRRQHTKTFNEQLLTEII